jgi:hypothetical protein
MLALIGVVGLGVELWGIVQANIPVDSGYYFYC